MLSKPLFTEKQPLFGSHQGQFCALFYEELTRKRGEEGKVSNTRVTLFICLQKRKKGV